jgi:hypothetical protein
VEYIMSSPTHPLRAFVDAVAAHRDAWLNVLGNPLRRLESVLTDGTDSAVAAVLAERPHHTLNDPPVGPDLETLMEGAEARIAQGDLPVDIRTCLRSLLRDLCDAHQVFTAEVRRSHAEGVHEVLGTPVLKRPLPGESNDEPLSVLDRLDYALMDFQSLVNVVEATRTITYTQTGDGKILDGQVVEVGILTPHDFSPEPSFAKRTELFRHRVKQSVIVLRGAASAGQRTPDYQAKVDEALTWWARHLHQGLRIKSCVNYCPSLDRVK